MIADVFGRYWPGVSPTERCSKCGQPDSCGDCTCQPLSRGDVVALGGTSGPSTNDKLTARGLTHQQIGGGLEHNVLRGTTVVFTGDIVEINRWLRSRASRIS